MKTNCHTHTTFCDGKNTPEEMVLSAIEKGFDVLGFSGHGTMNFPNDWNITEENIELYKKEISSLKEKYKNRIEILLGLELDADYTQFNREDYDYVIGSVHQLKVGDEIYSMDFSAKELFRCIEEAYGSSPSAMAKAYFERLADFIAEEEVDIVGHFDLITKFNEKTPVFDEADELYRKAAVDSVAKILEAKPKMVFEVNTGAMYRKGNKRPYPAPFILEEIRKRGGQLVLTSDAHCTEALDFAFEEAMLYCKKNGFEKILHLTKGGFVTVNL